MSENGIGAPAEKLEHDYHYVSRVDLRVSLRGREGKRGIFFFFTCCCCCKIRFYGTGTDGMMGTLDEGGI